MSKIKPEQIGLILSLNSCIEIVNGTISRGKDSIKRARSHESKEASKRALEFYAALSYHLNRLKQIQDGKAK